MLDKLYLKLLVKEWEFLWWVDTKLTGFNNKVIVPKMFELADKINKEKEDK